MLAAWRNFAALPTNSSPGILEVVEDGMNRCIRPAHLRGHVGVFLRIRILLAIVLPRCRHAFFIQMLLSSTQTDQQSKHDALLATEKRLKTVNLLIRNTGQYLANKKVYGEYMKAKNKKQFRQEHESEILLYEAARKALNELSGGEKIPTLKQLRAEKEELTAKKNEQYESYSFARAKYRELQTIQANVQSILRDTPEAMREHDQELS